MKVLQVNTVCGRGSTGRIVVALHDALRERGDDCLIAYGRGAHAPGVDAFKMGTSLSTGMHVGLSRLTDRQGFYSAGATRGLVDRIDKYRPDVIHLHNVHGYYLNLPLLFGALARSRAQVIWTLHDCWAFTGHCAYFDFVGCDKWLTHCGNCPQKGSYPASYGLDNSARNFDDKRRLSVPLGNLTLVTPSEWLAGLVSQSFLKGHSVEVIRNGIDQATFRPTASDFRTAHGVGARVMILGVASPWSERKGMRDFVELSRKLGGNFAVVLVGVASDQVRTLPPEIIAIKRTDSSRDLAAIYSAADVFLNPTYEDNYPTTNLEAMSCGTPVVTYDTGGSPESVAGGWGIVVRRGDVDAARTAIIELSGRLRPSHGIDPSFDQGSMAKKYLELYDSKMS